MTGAQCVNCQHFRLLQTCRAFPDGIPEPIMLGDFNHEEAYDGDNGILFAEVDDDEHIDET